MIKLLRLKKPAITGTFSNPLKILETFREPEDQISAFLQEALSYKTKRTDLKMPLLLHDEWLVYSISTRKSPRALAKKKKKKSHSRIKSTNTFPSPSSNYRRVSKGTRWWRWWYNPLLVEARLPSLRRPFT